MGSEDAYYEETFEQVFRTLLSTLYSEHTVEPYYAEIMQSGRLDWFKWKWDDNTDFDAGVPLLERDSGSEPMCRHPVPA